MLLRALAAALIALPVWADTVVPTRTIRANAVISETDVTLSNAGFTNGYTRIADVIGQEARVALYPGRPILIDDIGPPAIVSRNQLVRVVFQSNGLSILTEGRALERGALGDRVRIMNLTSRTTVFGQVLQDGTIRVSH